MKVVSRFEASLLTIARAITGLVPLDEAMHLLRREEPAPRCLSRTAVALLQDSLAKGIVSTLARWGWHNTAHLGARGVTRGRLWERVPPAARALHFSPATLDFLMQITAHDIADPVRSTRVSSKERTLGDEIVNLLALLAVEGTPMAQPLVHYHPFGWNSLTYLLAPNLFLDSNATPCDTWNVWLAPERSWLLEALQSILARRWLGFEQAKQQLAERHILVRSGERQHEILANYLNALEAAGRRDLARFLLVAGGKLLLAPRPNSEWFANLDMRGLRLAEREHAYRDGLGVLGEFARLDRWQHEALHIGYYDLEYAASQLWKSDWEALGGAEVCAAAAAVLRRYTSLKQWETST